MNNPKKPYIIGLIGYGYWGEKIAQHILTQQLLVFDIDKHRLDLARKNNLNTTNNLTYFYESVAAVVIATPELTHEKLIHTSLSHNKHVLVEKPLALTCEKAKELISLAKKHTVVLMQANTFLFDKAFIKLKTLLAEQHIGSIVHIASTRISTRISSSCDNVIIDLFPHDIYIFTTLFGHMPLALNITSKNIQNNKLTQATVNLKFHHATVSTTVEWSNNKERTFQVFGTKGEICWKQKTQNKDVVSLRTNSKTQRFLFNDKKETLTFVISDFIDRIKYPFGYDHQKNLINQALILEKTLALI